MTTAVGSYATTSLLKEVAGITDTTDDTLLGKICDRVNQYIESTTKQPICPISSATYTYDGNGLNRIFLPMPLDAATKGIGGLRAITLLEFAPYTRGTFTTIASTDYALRDRFGVNGPYRWLRFSDKPAGTYSAFPTGRNIVRITATAGWSAIPDDITEVALLIAHRAWNARQVSYASVQENFEQPDVQRFVSGRDRETLKRYMLRPPV